MNYQMFEHTIPSSPVGDCLPFSLEDNLFIPDALRIANMCLPLPF
jgi:hypothetical protein